MTSILGISAFYHDSAAALVVNGDIVAAAQEERFSRVKHDAAFPHHAVAYCLREAALREQDLDHVAFYERPLSRLTRWIETSIAFAPDGLDGFSRVVHKGFRKQMTRSRLRKELGGGRRAKIHFLDHHESHAASAFYPSPFGEAAILTLDGAGEWSTACVGRGQGATLQLSHHMLFPHSLGLLYSAFTDYCGFKVNSGEYKLMGLAPFGRPVYYRTILDNLMDLKPDGSFWLDMQYFRYCHGLTMTSPSFHALFGGPPRHPESRISQRHCDLAASIQAITEDVVLRMSRELHRQTGLDQLALAGGVALNAVSNGRLQREGPFRSVWVQPAAGDAGGALGAALAVWYQTLGHPRYSVGRDCQHGTLLGPGFRTEEIRQLLENEHVPFRLHDDQESLVAYIAERLAAGQIVGWFHGRMEFGPRALGARSILADPRKAQMQSELNLKIKFRESFRPFAPSVLQEHAAEWFEMPPGEESPYMLFVVPVHHDQRLASAAMDDSTVTRPKDLCRWLGETRSTVPAITHVDYSARVQTVDPVRNSRFYRLIKAFHRLTGCPMLVNTSFNIRGEPIVCTPREALQCFRATGIDLLVLEDLVIHKSDLPDGTDTAGDNYLDRFPSD